MKQHDCSCDPDQNPKVRILELRHEITSQLLGLSFILDGADPDETHYTSTELTVEGEVFEWEFEWPYGAYQITVKPPPLLVELDDQLREKAVVDREFAGIAAGLYNDTKLMRKASQRLRRAELGKKQK